MTEIARQLYASNTNTRWPFNQAIASAVPKDVLLDASLSVITTDDPVVTAIDCGSRFYMAIENRDGSGSIGYFLSAEPFVGEILQLQAWRSEVSGFIVLGPGSLITNSYMAIEDELEPTLIYKAIDPTQTQKMTVNGYTKTIYLDTPLQFVSDGSVTMTPYTTTNSVYFSLDPSVYKKFRAVDVYKPRPIKTINGKKANAGGHFAIELEPPLSLGSSAGVMMIECSEDACNETSPLTDVDHNLCDRGTKIHWADRPHAWRSKVDEAIEVQHPAYRLEDCGCDQYND
jgi:hypothetical protein